MLVCRRISRVAEVSGSMTRRSRQAPMRIFGYIRGHWRGTLSLHRSFWVNGLVTALVVGVLTTFAVDAIYKSDLKDGAWAFSTLAIFGLCIIITAWTVVGILRSATNYLQQGGRVALAVTTIMQSGAAHLPLPPLQRSGENLLPRGSAQLPRHPEG